MNTIFRHNANDPLSEADVHNLNETEWLVTNGVGGYASGTVSGTLTRVFHGYLIAALSSPKGRTMMLNDILEHAILQNGDRIRLNGERTASGEYVGWSKYLTAFRLDSGLPVWVYELGGLTLEKRLVLPHGQNTTYVTYRITSGEGSLKLELRPAVNMREHEAPVNTPIEPYTLTVRDHEYELQKSSNEFPPLRLTLMGKEAGFSFDCLKIHDVIYSLEKSRGYIYQGDLWSPGYFTIDVTPSDSASLIASTENWDIISALDPHQAWDSEQDRKRRLLLEAHPTICNHTCKELVWAADQFIFTPVGRPEDTARAWAAGDEIRDGYRRISLVHRLGP